jgi:hypothetical protein
MNIAMEQTEEYVNGQLKNKYGDAFIRGNNGTSWISKFISLYASSPASIISPSPFYSLLMRMYHDACCLNAVLYISTSKRTLTDGA